MLTTDSPRWMRRAGRIITVIVVVFLSLLPPIIEFIKHKFGKKDIIIDAVEDDKAIG